MLFKPYPGTRKVVDLLPAIAPIFRIDEENGTVELIGTGFWVTKAGHLITAWHVVDENIGCDGIDRGPIFAVQTLPDRSIVVRNFRKSDKHPKFDLALTETVVAPPAVDVPTVPIAMSLDELRVDEHVFSFAVISDDQEIADEKVAGHTPYVFAGELLNEQHSPMTVRFAIRLSFGRVAEIFEEMRDRVMLPFPCIQTDVPIYGGNSGGPLFDIRGRICAVHCTSFGGNDVAFHVPIVGVLHLRMRTQSTGIGDSVSKYRSVLELAVDNQVQFDPPMLDADRLVRSLIRWIWYAARRLIRGERPSVNVHFATGREPPKLSKTEN
ncbi:MAG TPA: serine protease [Rhodanobacter sp.]|nr:serine protease [Rhodanobacter sp.]